MQRHTPSHHPLTQPPHRWTPRPSKLQPRRVRHLTNLSPQQRPLTPQQRLLKRLPPRPKPPHHHLNSDPANPKPGIQLMQRPHGTALRHLLPAHAPTDHRHPLHRVRRQLVRGVETRPLRFFEADIAAGEAADHVARRLREGDVRVVLVREDVQVIGLVDGGAGARPRAGFGVGGLGDAGELGGGAAGEGWRLRWAGGREGGFLLFAPLGGFGEALAVGQLAFGCGG
jgi:hypothetical protein